MHSTKNATPKMYCTQDQKQCTKDPLHTSNRTNEAPPKMPLHSIPKVHIHNTRDAMHRRCSAPKKYCNQYAAHHRCIASYIYAAHQRCIPPKIKCTRDAAYLVCRSPPVLLSLHNYPWSYEGSLKASPQCPCT